MGGGGGGATYEPVKNCATISFNTDINSPQKDELDGLKVKDKLNVILSDNIVVIVQPDTQNPIGSINWSSIARLIECINLGYEYVATVRDIQDGLVKINISAK